MNGSPGEGDPSSRIDKATTEKVAAGELRHLKNFDPAAPSPSMQPQMQRYHTLLNILRNRYGTDNVVIEGPFDETSGEVTVAPAGSKEVGIYVTAEAFEANQ